MAVKSFIMLGILQLLAGCSGLSLTKGMKPFWASLYDYSEEQENAFDEATKYLSVEANRKEVLVFCQVSLEKDSLRYKDEIRLARIVQILHKSLADHGQSTIPIRELKTLGARHISFFVTVCDAEPEEIDVMLDFLDAHDGKRTVARVTSPKGPPVDYPAELFLIKKLQYATGKDFGTDFAAWRKWWNQNKDRLTYDSETGRFMSP